MTAPANKQLNARGGVRCPQQRRLGPPRVFTDYARRRRAKPTPRSLSVIHTQTRMRLATQSAGATAPTRSEHPHPPPRAAWSGAQQGGLRRGAYRASRRAAPVVGYPEVGCGGAQSDTGVHARVLLAAPRHPLSAHTNTARHSKTLSRPPRRGEGDTGAHCAPHLYRPQAAL